MNPPRTAAEAAEPAGRSAASSTAVSMHDFGIALRPDAGRLVARFFVPGKEDLGPGDSRAAGVIDRILALTDDEVAEAMADLDDRFGHHYVALGETFEQHAAWLSPAVEPTPMSASRRRLIGAAFTSEYAIEGAALCNPSIVRHPEQGGDGTAFVMSVRSIGEGHRSSIGFRTGSVTADGAVVVDVPGRWPEISSPTPGVHHRSVLHRKLADLGDDHENAALALDALPAEFEDEQLRKRIYALWEASATRRHTERTVANLRRLADCAYRVEFRAETHISERVLWPHSPTETHGMEDARFVEITDGSAPRYCATYTAFDGANIMQNLLTTEDFRSFEISPMAGRAAIGKGLALFP